LFPSIAALTIAPLCVVSETILSIPTSSLFPRQIVRMVKGWTVVALLSAIGALMLLSISKIPDVIHKPGHDISWKRIGSHSVIENDASEFRSDDGIFPRAREWYDYWTYASSKGEDRLEESHVHDAYVALAVKSVSAATLRHINDMKLRYDSAGALPDFYARGIGWIKEVSSSISSKLRRQLFVSVA
jgi:hypothetical protein